MIHAFILITLLGAKSFVIFHMELIVQNVMSDSMFMTLIILIFQLTQETVVTHIFYMIVLIVNFVLCLHIL